MDKAQFAEELFKKGYNCAQAVFGAFAEDMGLDFDAAMRLSSGFGGGMGRMREVCGAVTGMFMAIGLKKGNSDPSSAPAKTAAYDMTKNLAERFEKEKGSMLCRELIGLKRGETPPPAEWAERLTICAACVRCAARLAEEEINAG